MIESSINCNQNYKKMLLFSFLFATVGLAIAVPYLALFISFFGALCLSVLGIAFPAVMEICVLYPDKWGFCYNVILRNAVLIIIGMFALITGTHKSISDIIVAIQKERNETMFNLTTTTIPPSF